MSEYTDVLERARQQFPPTEGGFERLTHRRDRKQRNRRIGAAVVAVVVTVVAFLGLTRTLRSDNRPASMPTPAPNRITAWFEAARGRIVVPGRDAQGRHTLVALDPSGRAKPAILTAGTTMALGFSRDGNRLLAMHGYGQLVVLDSDGGRILVRAPRVASASLSPEGSSIAVPLWKRGLMIYPVSGGSPRRVAGTYGVVTASWSPDGTKLAYFSAVSLRDWTMRVINADGSGRKVLVNLRGRYIRYVSMPVWSPDGSRLAFADQTCRNCGSLYVVNADGTSLRRVTPSQTNAWAPGWSPDGSRIAFMLNGAPATIRPDGSGTVRLRSPDCPSAPGVGPGCRVSPPVLAWDPPR